MKPLSNLVRRFVSCTARLRVRPSANMKSDIDIRIERMAIDLWPRPNDAETQTPSWLRLLSLRQQQRRQISRLNRQPERRLPQQLIITRHDECILREIVCDAPIGLHVVRSDLDADVPVKTPKVSEAGVLAELLDGAEPAM